MAKRGQKRNVGQDALAPTDAILDSIDGEGHTAHEWPELTVIIMHIGYGGTRFN
jgi:hypothetical protein